MNTTLTAITEAIGWTLVHFLWQGAAIAICLWLFSTIARRAGARWQYAAGCTAMASMLAAAVATFTLRYEAPPSDLGPVAIVAEGSGIAVAASAGYAPELPPMTKRSRTGSTLAAAARPASTAARVQGWLAGLVAVWAIGVCVLSLRFLINWGGVRRMRQAGRAVSDHPLLARLAALLAQLKISRPVSLLSSTTAQVPLVIGWLKPAILIPAGLLSGLDPRQLEAILAHELAHVRRHDYLINLLQSLVESLLFFHPAVWWTSALIRKEREHCCDDIAARHSGGALEYGRALAALEAELGAQPPLIGLAASGGNLLQRIRRLAGSPDPQRSAWPAALVSLSAVAILAIGLLINANAQEKPEINGKPEAEAEAEDKAEQAAAATAHPFKGMIRINVLDETGQIPIKNFRVLAGTPMPDRPGDEKPSMGANWQAHTIKAGLDGQCLWPLAHSYDQMALRVEADGYIPQAFAWLEKSKGEQDLFFGLRDDPGIGGVALLPDGSPAAGALVCLTLPHKNAIIENGTLRHAGKPRPESAGDRWRQPAIVEADVDGRFKIATETDPTCAIVAVHPQGIAEMRYQDFRANPKLTTRAWGRVEGQVATPEGAPMAGQKVVLNIARITYGFPDMVKHYVAKTTPADGRFAFEKVPPGIANLTLVDKPSAARTSEVATVDSPGSTSRIDVASGKTTMANLKPTATKKESAAAAAPALEVGKLPKALRDALAWGKPDDGGLVAAISLDPLQKSYAIGAMLDRSYLVANLGNQEAAFNMVHWLEDKSARFKITDKGGARLEHHHETAYDDGAIAILPVTLKPGEYVRVPSSKLFLRRIPLSGLSHPGTYIESPPGTVVRLSATIELGGIGDLATGETQFVLDAPGVEKPENKPAAEKPITVRGKILDDITGEPVTKFIIQGGRFEPEKPGEFTWGYSESGGGSKEGMFSTNLQWHNGWTARILADGYLPEPILTELPPDAGDTIELTLRLKRGRIIRGQVLDHVGKPVVKASVFRIGPTGLQLAGGAAWNSWGNGQNNNAQYVTTGDTGKFEISSGGVDRLAVSSADLDAWPSLIPEDVENGMVIRLPEPASITIEYDIEGGDEKGDLFFQSLMYRDPLWKGLEVTGNREIKNGSNISFNALPPGPYQFSRNASFRIADFGFGAMLDRSFIQLKPGEKKVLRLVRENGTALGGKTIQPDGAEIAGTIVTVKALTSYKDPFSQHEWTTEFAATLAGDDGSYKTERVPPGRYRVIAEGYEPIKPENKFRSGIIGPSHRAEVIVEIPEKGATTHVPDLKLEKVR